jgi:hypothetical protein
LLALLVASAPALAQSLPLCADKAMLGRLRMQYQLAEDSSANPKKLSGIADVRETSLGPPPASASQYATAETFVAETRYCEAEAALEGSESEALYWRIDHRKDHGESSYRLDHCSARHDVFHNGCADWRPGK